MSKKKKLNKSTRARLLREAKKRLPSSKLVRCDMCFSPRNTLTVKPHLESAWLTEEIDIDQTNSIVKIPCKSCKNARVLSLSSISFGLFLSEVPDYSSFILLKDGRFNALVGFEEIDKSITIKGGEIDFDS